MALSPPIAIAARIRTLPRHDGRPVLVAIDGPGGAGKTWLARALADELARAATTVAIVHGDDFARPRAERPGGDPASKPIGGDFDWQRLRDDVLMPLRGGRPGRYARYDWDRDALADEVTVGPAAVVLVEGIYVGRRELRPLYDLRMWVEAARTIRLARGLARDGEAARARWEDEWMPSEDRYVRAHEPRAAADLIVRGDAPTFAVRPAEIADLPGIHEVHVRSIRELARGHYSADEVEAWAGRLPPGIHAQALREHVCEVAVDDSGVLGFAEVDVARGEVRAVYVHPAAARRGVGTLLLARVEERARAAGLTRLVLDASVNAVPFYEHGGFTSDRSATHALEGGGAIRCVRMSKQLPQGEPTPPRTT